MRRAIALLAFSVLAGCSSVPSDVSYVTFTERAPAEGRARQEVGTGVQWTHDYAVTAASVYTGMRSDGMIYLCQECELKFVPRHTAGQVPAWRDPKPRETLYVAGNAPGQVEAGIVVQGRDSYAQTKIDGLGDQWLNLADIVPPAGMSSGPVYGSDGKVVGYMTGFVEVETPSGVTRQAVYVPYASIKSHWESFTGSR